MIDDDWLQRRRWDLEMDAAREAWADVWGHLGAAISMGLVLALAFGLAGCAYIDPYMATAQAIKEDAKKHIAVANDAVANDIADAAKAITTGALARMPAGERKCALATLQGLMLVECVYRVQPASSGAQ